MICCCLLLCCLSSCSTETEEFLGDVDEDLEAMQGTVYLLQQELKDAKERLQQQQLELDQLRARTIATGNVNSVPAAASSELLPTTTVNRMTGDSNDSSDVMMKASSELMRTAGKDSTRITEEKFVKNMSCEDFESLPVCGNQRSASDDGSRIQNMDVDSSEMTAKCGYSNDVRTSPVEHANDDAVFSEQLADDSGLHKTVVDRFRTASKVSGAELATSDCVPNGTDDDKAVAVAGN